MPDALNPPSSIKVVVVDDDPQFRLLFTSALEGRAGIELLAVAKDGAGGLAALQNGKPHVLLVDLGLPDISGLDLIRYCASTHPHCEIMVISVFGDENHIIRSIEAGATGYLLKDAMPEDLLAQIHALRAGGTPISPVIARRLLRSHWGRAASPPLPETLSERERSVLELVAKGYNFGEFGRLLDISTHSVTTYVKRTYRKLQANSKTEAVYEARKLGLLRS